MSAPRVVRNVTITIRRWDKWYRAHCGTCAYISNQHADKRQARKVGGQHVEKKHPGGTAVFKGGV